MIVPLEPLRDKYPDNTGLKRVFNAYGLQSWVDIFSFRSLILVLSIPVQYNSITILLKISIDFYRNQQEKLLIQQERNAMELGFLRMQIQPHFLFNSLNNIYGMVLDNPHAADSITKLSDLLRFSVESSKKEWIALDEEIAFLKDYIDLERIRHREDKVQITYDFTGVAGLEKQIKPLLLVNFIENAFKHGVNASAGKSWVVMALKEKNGKVFFSIRNSKPKHIESRREAISLRGKKEESGVGLENVRRRLELEYPERYTLNVRETEAEYQVELLLVLD